MSGRKSKRSSGSFLVGRESDATRLAARAGSLCIALALAATLTANALGGDLRLSFADELDDAALGASATELVPQDADESSATAELVPQDTDAEAAAEAVGLDRYEPNGDAASAVDVGFPARLDATLHNAGDEDWYLLELEESATVALMLTSPLGAPYRMTLVAADGSFLKVSEYSNGIQSIHRELSAGTYYVAVEGIDGAFDADDAYSLSLQRQIDPASLSSLDLSEMNMLMAMIDKENSPYAWDYGIDGGGHFLMAQAYLSSWAGPVTESADPYPDPDNAYDSALSATFEDLSDQAVCRVQNAIYLPAGNDPAFSDDLKAAVMTYGSAQVHVVWAEGYATPDSRNLYVDQEDYAYATMYDGGHALVVVGWDDSYPKENFTGNPNALEDLGYSDVQLSQPESDGAWICKNSWGDDAGAGGYVYVSYEDAFIGTNNPAVYLADDSTDNYDFQYLNDPKGTAGFIDSDVGEPLTSSEIFVNTKDSAETLRAVSFVTGTAARYEISVTVGDETTVVATGEKRYCGYFTVHVGDAAVIEPGQAFRIDVTLTSLEPGTGAYIGVCTNAEGMVGGVEAVSDCAFIEGVDAGEQGVYPNIRAYTDGSESGALEQAVLYGSDARSASDAAASARAEVAPEPSGSYDADAVLDRLGGITVTSVNSERYGSIGISIDSASSGSSVFARSLGVALPATFDLRKEGTLTSVKNQGDLGSCWTFAAMACVENYLARSNVNVTANPRSVSLSDDAVSVTLKDGEEQAIDLCATLEGTDNPPLSTVAWSVSGDVDSVRLETVRTESGEEATVLTALDAGTVTVRAESDADMSVAAECVVTIAKEQVVLPSTEGEDEPKGSGDEADGEADDAGEVGALPDTGDAGAAVAVAAVTAAVAALGALAAILAARTLVRCRR